VLGPAGTTIRPQFHGRPQPLDKSNTNALKLKFEAFAEHCLTSKVKDLCIVMPADLQYTGSFGGFAARFYADSSDHTLDTDVFQVLKEYYIRFVEEFGAYC